MGLFDCGCEGLFSTQLASTIKEIVNKLSVKDCPLTLYFSLYC